MKREQNLKKQEPLANRMRPRELSDFVGQREVIDEEKFLYRSIKSDRISSMIFYGPPGTGKTTLARIIANKTDMNFVELSAVTSGVKDIREVVKQSENFLELYEKRTIVFIDEIHRFNKSQQDALLPYVEKGLLTLIGATTENPYFEVNDALLSRVAVIPLKKLDDEDLELIIEKALSDKEKGLGNLRIELDEKAKNFLVNRSEGDARFLLNALEMSALSTEAGEDGVIHLDISSIENSIYQRNLSYDKDGDEHYNIISAFIKSVRGSDVDSSLYWLARMIESGEDPKFIARRILILASEDIGMADPNALVVCNAVFDTVLKLGMPECVHALSQGVVYLATAPKSNSSYVAIKKARDYVRKNKAFDVPDHLKDSHYKGAEKLGHGKGYLYPHDYKGNFVEQRYSDIDEKFYEPSDNGFEKKLKNRDGFDKS